MFTCKECGAPFTAGAVAIVGMPQPSVCPACRRRVLREAEEDRAARNRFYERVSAVVMLLAAIVCLAGMLRGEWKRTDPNQPYWQTEPSHVDPEPGGAVPEELPRIESAPAGVMSLDY